MRWQARRAAVPEGQVCLTEAEEYSIGSTSCRYRQCPVLSCPVLYGSRYGYVREMRPGSSRQSGCVATARTWDGHIVTLRPPVDACTVCYPREYCATSIASGACLVVVALSRNRFCQDHDRQRHQRQQSRRRRRQQHHHYPTTTRLDSTSPSLPPPSDGTVSKVDLTRRITCFLQGMPPSSRLQIWYGSNLRLARGL
jgi:hypothetical protein